MAGSTTSMRSTIRLAAVSIVLLASFGVASAGRRRVVVLDFDGPKAEVTHEAVIEMIKKHDAVVPTDKWNATAADLDAVEPTDRNVRRIGKKLHLDAVITGLTARRGDHYVFTLKLRDARTGEVVRGPVEIVSSEPRPDHDAKLALKDFASAIDDL